MAPSDVLKQYVYEPGDVVFLGGHISEACRGFIRGRCDDDETYIVDIGDTYIRIHESSILGKELTTEQKLINISAHTTNLLLDLQRCIQENEKLRQRIKVLQSNIANKNIRDSLELQWQDTFGNPPPITK